MTTKDVADTKVHYEPHEGQKALHKARQGGVKRVVVRAARRFGKGRQAFGDLMAAYDTALKSKRAPHLVPPFHAWMVIPSFPQGRQAWHELMSLMPRSFMTKTPVESDWIIYLRGNTNWQNRAGIIEIKSAFDPNALQTVGLDFLWISESQDVDNAAFEKVLPTTRSPERLGWEHYEGIPALYKDHWFERIWDVSERDKKVFTLHATYLDNPLLTDEHREEIENDRNILSAASWERLYLARFNTNAGFFRNIEDCVQGDLLAGPIPGRRYVGGYDVGWTNNPSVLYILDMERRQVVHFIEWDTRLSMQDKHAHLEALHSEWDFQDIEYDASGPGGKAVQEDLSVRPLPCVPVTIDGQTRKDLLERLAGATERKTIGYPQIQILLRQLRAMQYFPTQSGLGYQLRVPAGENDDHVFALALALSACTTSPVYNTMTTIKPMRYVPTQAEVNGQVKRAGGKMMEERRRQKLRDRAVVAGVLD
jgi:hypothetical protein